MHCFHRREDENDIKEMFPNAVFEYIDAGHWLHAEKPTEFLQLVYDFLRIK